MSICSVVRVYSLQPMLYDLSQNIKGLCLIRSVAYQFYLITCLNTDSQDAYDALAIDPVATLHAKSWALWHSIPAGLK